ncbi:hypothetical protein H0H92_004763 [Tricholoma furcatifolium]|nr:hypothetical protein H0H92_004763 [Tricholoma furcatifolium]
MVRSTIIVRASDALPLAASVDDEQTEQSLQEHKQQAKLIFRRITPNSEPRCSIESGQYTLHYLISENVVFLTIADKSYPRKLAFSYLDELSKEFATTYGPKVETVRKPYAFVGFDTFMSKTARLYRDTRTATATSSLDRLNDDLQDVTRIMTKNMEELLWRGDSLDRMSHLSTSLRSESEKYRKAARNINFNAMIRQYAPLGAVGLLNWFRWGQGLVTSHLLPVISPQMQRAASPYRSTSPYGPPPPDNYRQSYTPAPPPAMAAPPGSITYTTLPGQDGRPVYQLFKYGDPTGNGRQIMGIQWVKGEITTKLPPGAQPPTVDAQARERRKSFNASSPPGAGIYGPGPYSGYADGPAGAPAQPYSSNATNAGYYAADLDRKMGDMNLRDRGRDYRSTHAPVPQKYSSNDVTGAPPRAISPHPGVPRAVSPHPGGNPAVAGPYNSATASGAYSRSPNMRAASPNPHPAQAPFVPPAPGGYPPYSRSASPNRAPDPLPRAASPYGPPAGHLSRAASPYGPPAGPQHRPTSPYGPPAGPPPRSTTPYGAAPAAPAAGAPPAVYPRGHIMEGQPILPTDRARASPMPPAANLPPAGPYSSSAVAAPRAGTSPNIPPATVPFAGNPAQPPHQLAAPEGFSRPVNGSHAFTPFDIMKIQDMERFWSEVPRMPNVLNTHDVFEEDWRRLMQDMALAWAGRLPVEQEGPAAQRTAIIGDLIDLWNQSFFLIRGIELVLFRGKERRTGRYAGTIERDLPYLEEPDDYISSEDESSDDSDSDLDYGSGRFQHAYGDPHQTLSEVFEEGRRRKEQKLARKAERKRKRQEKHRRRREKYRARKYALYMTYVPTSVTAGNNYGGHGGYPTPGGAGYAGGRY